MNKLSDRDLSKSYTYAIHVSHGQRKWRGGKGFTPPPPPAGTRAGFAQGEGYNAFYSGGRISVLGLGGKYEEARNKNHN